MEMGRIPLAVLPQSRFPDFKYSVRPVDHVVCPSLVSLLTFLSSPLLLSVPKLHTQPLRLFSFFCIGKNDCILSLGQKLGGGGSKQRKLFFLPLGFLMIFEGIMTQNAVSVA